MAADCFNHNLSLLLRADLLAAHEIAWCRFEGYETDRRLVLAELHHDGNCVVEVFLHWSSPYGIPHRNMPGAGVLPGT